MKLFTILTIGSAARHAFDVSPVKRNTVTKTKKKSPQASKRTITLNGKKSSSKENLESPKKNSQKLKHSYTQKSNLTKRYVGSDGESKTFSYKRRNTDGLDKSNTFSPPKTTSVNKRYDYKSSNEAAVNQRLADLEHHFEEKQVSETTEESEDPLHERNKLPPSIKIYNKERDGGMLYAFLDLQKCRRLTMRPPVNLHKAESYNAVESNYQAYQKTIVSVGISGINRQNSTVESSYLGSLSEEDYKRVMELKNQRMKNMFKK